MKLTELLSGTRILEKTRSKYNGEIEVIRDFTFGTYIKVGGLTQSGGIVTHIWKEILKNVLERKPQIQNCLILGLGGGSSAKLVSQYWVNSEIIGVDIDKKIVELGKKYLRLNKIDLNVEIEDAYKFIFREKQKYDLILIDLYNGDKFPEKFENVDFLMMIKKHLKREGMAVFNRLYGSNNRKVSMKFGEKLEKVFKKCDYIYPQANVCLICYN